MNKSETKTKKYTKEDIFDLLGIDNIEKNENDNNKDTNYTNNNHKESQSSENKKNGYYSEIRKDNKNNSNNSTLSEEEMNKLNEEIFTINNDENILVNEIKKFNYLDNDNFKDIRENSESLEDSFNIEALVELDEEDYIKKPINNMSYLWL
jgi:hypothetical protein